MGARQPRQSFELSQWVYRPLSSAITADARAKASPLASSVVLLPGAGLRDRSAPADQIWVRKYSLQNCRKTRRESGEDEPVRVN